MKRVAALLGMAVAAPGAAWAQAPTPAAATATQPAAPSSPPSAPQEAPPPAPELTPAAPPPPGDQYYVEPPASPTEATAPSAGPPPFEPPPPPGAPLYEPPPPPEPRHLAPKMALWVGARLGWFVPFGNVWADAVVQGADGSYVLEGRPWSDFAASGPLLELDIGARLSRNYTVFALWERAQLRSGDVKELDGAEQDGAESDFWALGLRASSDPNRIGFLTEVAIGLRRARTTFVNGVEYQFTDAPLEARLGLGADIRLSRTLTLSPLATIGVGAFSNVQRVARNGTASSLTRGLDQNDGHAWATLMIGGHFDLFPSRN